MDVLNNQFNLMDSFESMVSRLFSFQHIHNDIFFEKLSENKIKSLLKCYTTSNIEFKKNENDHFVPVVIIDVFIIMLNE